MRLVIPNLMPGKNYAVQVRANYGDSQSNWSARHQVVVASDLTRPEIPQNVTWEVSGDSFFGEWDAVTQNTNSEDIVVSRYEVQLSGNSKVVTVSVPAQTGARVNFTLNFEQNRAVFGSPAATVSMQVRAVDAKGAKSDLSSSISKTNPAPAEPDNVSADEMYDAVSLTWDASEEPDLQHYLVQVSYTGMGGPYLPVHTGASTSFIHHTTQFNTDHYYRVFVVDKFNTASSSVTVGPVRPKSTFAVDDEPPENASNFSVVPNFDVNTQTAYADVSWDSSTSTDVGRYIIRYSTDGINWQYEEAPHDENGLRIENLIPNASYYFSIRTSDFTGNMSAWQNHSPYPITSAEDTTPPSQPAAPSATAGTQRIQVTVTGNKSGGGVMEPDVDYYEVFASTTNNFSTYNSTTMLGTIQSGPAMVETFQIPASAASGTSQTWYVKVRAVDRSGNVSPASVQATAAVGLIETANIGDAQITNAKISNLSADKLEAGTINTGDINVASNIIVGTASSPGAIKSYNYNGAEGFLIDKSGITIKTGTIEAAALNIQQGGNLMPPQYADFEFSADAYEEDRLENVNATISTTARAHGQSRKVWWNSVPGGTRIMWMAPTGEVYKTNLISDASMEDVGTGWYGAFAWTGVVPTENSSVSWHGERSLEFKSPAAGDGFAVYPFETTDMEVEPNKGYAFSVYVYSPSVSRNAAAAITYFDSSGTMIGSVHWGSTSATTVGQWQRFGVVATSPANAAYAQVGVYIAGTAQNEVHLIDAALFQKANVLHNFFEGTIIDTSSGEPQENIVVEPGQSYVVSAYFNAATTFTPVEFVAWDNNGNLTTMTNYRYNDVATSAPITLTPLGTWKRVSAVWTAPAGVTHVALGVRSNSTNPGEYLVDAVQFEPKTSLSTRPSTWMPGGMGTTIDGGLIKTGAIQSNQPAYDVNGNEIPGIKAWSINTDGSAVLGNALIRGTLVMGAEGAEEPIGPDGPGTSQGVSEMRSYNYVPGAQGWSIRSNGEAEFLQLRSGSIHGEAIAAGSFRPDQLGDGTIAAEVLIGNRMFSEERIQLEDALYIMSRTNNQLTLNSAIFNYFEEVPVGGRLKMKVTTEVSSVVGAEISGGVATLTFADERYATFEIGDELDVSGVGILYDTRGTTPVVSATATTVSYAVDSDNDPFHISEGTVTSVYTDLTNEADGFVVLGSTPAWEGSGNSSIVVSAPGGDFDAVALGEFSDMFVEYAFVIGRRVNISPAGLQLIEPTGLTSVDMPTDSTRPSRFSGAVNTSELLVDDGLSLSGETNKMTSGSVLTLASLANNPTGAPKIASGGPAETINSWVNGDDEYSSRRQGFGIYGDKFYFANMFWGGQQMVMNADGTYSGNITMPTTTYRFNPYGGMVKLGSKWYVLGWSVDLDRWQVWRFYSRADGLIGDFEVALFNYDERSSFGATAQQWNEGAYQKSPLGRPAIGTDGTNLYIARTGVSGEIRWTAYTAGGSKINNYRTNTTVRRGTDIASILIGNFDYGSKRYIVTTRNQNLDQMFGSGIGRNYVFSTTYGSKGYVQNTNESWNVYDDTWIGESDCLGLTWDGANFWSMQDTGNIFKYTDISKSGTTTIYAKYTWYDPQQFTVNVTKKQIINGVATLWLEPSSINFAEGDEVYVQGVGSGLDGYWISLNNTWSNQLTFSTPVLGDVIETDVVGGTVSNVEHETELSPVGVGTAKRRMSIRVTSPTNPPSSFYGGSTGDTGGSGRDPLSSARFYLSTNGTDFYLNNGVDGPTSNLFYGYGITLESMPETSGPTGPTARPFPRAIPAKIVSEDGELEISADGFIRTDRMILRSNRDANTDAGNTPALMVGNDAGNHLRIDNNEIISMTSPSSQGTLILNSGGQVNVSALRAASIVGPATIDGSLFVNNNMTVSGTATIGGKNISKMNFAQFSGTTNASGTVTIAHGMGVTPTFVAAFVHGTSTYACTVNGKNATNITLGVRNYATGSLVTGTNLTFQYFAID